MTTPYRYRSPDEDSGRWAGFTFRDGDIVISARSKTGTTWVQMICALLVFQTPELPEPLPRLSPWLDWLVTPRDEVFAQLAAQEHRRFVKSHTPLDGIPLDRRVTYVVTGRHPLDVAVSLYHQGANLDRARLRELTGRPVPEAWAEDRPRPPLHEWLRRWIDEDADPRAALDSLPGVLWHLTDAWNRRGRQDVLLVHYDDLSSDLDAEMRRIATRLGIAVPEERWPALVDAATFPRMRERAASIAPDHSGILKSPAAFFRWGSSGAGAETLTPRELARYGERVAAMAPPPLLAWLHRG